MLPVALNEADAAGELNPDTSAAKPIEGTAMRAVANVTMNNLINVFIIFTGYHVHVRRQGIVFPAFAL